MVTLAVEVLIGHGECLIINETSVHINYDEIEAIIKRIAGDISFKYKEVPQDIHLANNQKSTIKCGDNGIFKGMPTTKEQRTLTDIAAEIYNKYKTDGKYILNKNELIICQSNAKTKELEKFYSGKINPLGEWTGGINVDSGATNRKLGSDMGDSITGGGLHGKDLSKADVSLNIYAFLKAQELQKPVELYCAIGDDLIDGRSYSEIVGLSKLYIKDLGGFEKFAEWGLIRPLELLNKNKPINLGGKND